METDRCTEPLPFFGAIQVQDTAIFFAEKKFGTFALLKPFKFFSVIILAFLIL